MQLLDCFLIVLPLLIVAVAGSCARSHMRSVADFLSGSRLAGRYFLAIAGGNLQTGAVVFVGAFKVIWQTSFTAIWWQWLSVPVCLIVRISGFVICRYRQTRVLTLAQFSEPRYNKSFRVFTGVLAFLAGMANFGIIPAIGARCVVYFLSLHDALRARRVETRSA